LSGIAIGSGAAKLLTVLAEWPTLISPDAVITGFVFSAVVGIFFGFYPARKASQLDPLMRCVTSEATAPCFSEGRRPA